MGGVVAVSQVLLTDLLLLVRDALDLALGAASSATPAWAAALGHRPARAAALTLPLPADAALVLAEGDAGDVWPGRRLAGEGDAPPLPAGAPPRRALLQGADELGDYSEERYDDVELYDAEYYG
jgi:hypothetical protein